MGASYAFSDHCLPRKCFGKSTLRGCPSRKRDNIVLIEVDTDDFGDIIVLDVPESFQKKFRKKPEHVISIDDDDCGESSDGACHANSDAPTGKRCSQTEASDPSTSAHVNDECLFDNEGHAPVKLFNSKRTYSGKSISKNRYGLGPDSEGDSSESDGSDCELIEEFHEQWEKASYRRRNDANNVPPDVENKAGTTTRSDPVRNSAEEGIVKQCTPSDYGQQSNERNCSPRHDGDNVFAGFSQKFSKQSKASEQRDDPMEMNGQFARTCDDCISSGFDNKERSKTLGPECPVLDVAEQCTVNNAGPVGDSNKCTGKLAEHIKFQQQSCNAKTKTEVFIGDNCACVNKGPSQDVESDHAALFDRQQGTGILSMPAQQTSSCGQDDEVVSYIITDRQKIKETEEYKHAMEEEWAARKQQLLRQSEEAQRLRNRKRAENMRIMMNERRQKQRVEEIRQTRRKDEENLNLKEKHRAEIKAELRKIEASLLRCLGIHVGGGPYPSPNEVQAAYKRACLKFHPDRISMTDLRQQVDAEEKFKLISNMKDKFLLK